MPQMGESIFEGTITKWLKKVGDTVEKDEPLFEISTDKVDAEIPSPVAGVLTEIRAGEGETVQINAVVAVIGGAVRIDEGNRRAHRRSPQSDRGATGAAGASKAQSAPPQVDGSGSAHSVVAAWCGRLRRSTASICAWCAGSGSDGRINKEDILRYISEGAAGDNRRSVDAAASAEAEGRSCRSRGR